MSLPDPSAPLSRPDLPAVPALFAVWAERGPDRAAVCQGGRSLAYGELAAAAAEVAGELLAAGLRPGETVAIHSRRCPGLAAAMLGVLAAGGALLAVETDLPAERKLHLLKAAKVRHLLRLEADTPACWGAEVAEISLSPETGRPVSASGAAPAGLTEPLDASNGDAPAYVFFTSGSTGAPKGVLGCHRGLSHFLLWQREEFEVGPGDRCSQLTRLSFDPMLRDILLPLVSGACLCIPEEDDERPDRVIGWLESAGITVLHVVPSLARLWLDAAPVMTSGLDRLRLTFFNGEPLPADLVRAWREAFPRSGSQINLYGPTETTLAKCFHRLGEELEPGIQPVGRPLPQTQALVLDEAGRLCGIGEVGQIAIRTPFRSLGYLEAPEADRRRFRVNPWTGDPDDLLYDTGDLGRYRPDGLLEVLGRIDDQIKVRGVRVEPGEVEAALRALPGVRAAAVADRERTPGDRQLVAYVVAGEPAPASADLRRGLEAVLPSYMVPTWFVRLDALPLNANGKLDRRALPDPSLAGEGRAPGTEAERRVAAVWSEILGFPAEIQIGADQDLFTVGGDSVKALMIAARLGEAHGVAMPVTAVFERPTVAGQAAWIEEVRRYDSRHVERGHLVFGESRPGKLFAFPPLLGYGLAFYQLASFVPSRALYAFDFPEDLPEGGSPVPAWAEEVRRIDPEGPYDLVGYSAGGNLAFEVAAEIERGGGRVGSVILLDAERFVEPELMSDEEIDGIVQANLENLAGLMLADEMFRDFVRNGYARERMAAKTRAFLRYERGRTNDGPVRADLHFLCSTDRRECVSWADVTRGRFQLHPASGRHLEMIHASHAEVNGRLIEQILRGDR